MRLFPLILVLALPSAALAADAARGRLVFALAGGCGCHTPENGPVGAGGGEVPTPFGTYYGTNITPDRQYGIGDWSDAEIIAAIRTGTARGRVEAPTMPYYRYAGMSDEDAGDLVAYLRTLPPVARANTPHIGTPPFAALGYRVWRALFGGRTTAPVRRPQEPQQLGRYLVDHVAICGDCHTPRGPLGVPQRAQELAGTRMPGIGKVADIRPQTLLAEGWDAADLVALLTSGMKPDFDNVQGKMAELIDGHGGGPGYKHAARGDLEAMTIHLLRQ